MEINNQSCCLTCERSIHGRTDKRFCNDNCRNTYHNKNHQTQNNLVRNIKAILLRNRRILSETLGDKSTCTVHRAELVTKGFHFEFITQIHTNNLGSVTYCCYDYSYKSLTESSLQISKHKKR